MPHFFCRRLLFGIFFGGVTACPSEVRTLRQMKRVAVISSDKTLERAVVLALECAAAGKVEVVAAANDGDADRIADCIADCDTVVVLGAAWFSSGRLSAEALRNGCRRHGDRRTEIYVVSWQHGEQTVLGMLESGIDQYMTFPLSLRRLCIKVLGPRWAAAR